MNKKHYDLLKSCSDKKDMTDWNLFRLRNPNKKIDLKFSSLSNFYLMEANLQGIDLRYVLINNTKMNGADVKNSRLTSYTFLITRFIIMSLIIFYIGYFTDLIIIKTITSLNNLINNAFLLMINIFISSFIIIFLVHFINTSTSDVYRNIFTFVIQFIGIILFIFVFVGVFSLLFNLYIALFVITIIIFFGAMYDFNSIVERQYKSIANSKNPMEAINFNSKYLSNIKESEELKEELSKIEHKSKEQEKIKNELDNDKNLAADIRESFQIRLNALEKEETKRLETEQLLKARIDIIEKREDEEADIRKSMDAIKESFSHIDTIEKSIYYMNKIYGVLLMIGILMLIYFGYTSFENRETTFLQLKEITFSASLGIVIFYATPILFSFVIIVFSISNLNRNIKEKEKLLEKKYLIELIESTFYAQIRNGGDARDAMEKLIQKLADSAYEQLSLQVNKSQNENVQQKSYRDRIVEKRVDLMINALIKKI